MVTTFNDPVTNGTCRWFPALDIQQKGGSAQKRAATSKTNLTMGMNIHAQPD